MTGIIVHHLDQSRSHRILWLLEELELDYEVVTYTRDPTTRLAPDSLRAIHPLGKSPVVTDGDATLAESGAIIEHLVDAHGDGKLAPAPGTADRVRYRYWMHYAEGSAMPPLLLKLIFDLLPSRVPFLARPVVAAIAGRVKREYVGPQVKLHLDFMERELAERPYFAGEAFSAADVQMSFPIEAAYARGSLGEEYSNLRAFLERVSERPAFKRAVERGGPRDLAAL
jgi:glutathione S-transferase